MTLTEKAYLTVEDDAENEAVFEFQQGLETDSDLDKQFIMSDRGLYIQEIFKEFLGDEANLEGANRRKGYTIDGGAGLWRENLTFRTGLEDVQWGDGSADDTKDASGPDVKAITRKQVIEDWLARTRTDSLRPGKLYWGEWTDGRFEGTAGAFGRPMFVSVDEYNLQSPEVDQDVNSMQGTMTLSRIALFPDSVPEDLEEATQLVQDALEGIKDY